MKKKQLPLSLGLNPTQTFENFITDSSSSLLFLLQNFCSTSTEPYLYLCGPSGSGKSHLLQACCHTVSKAKGRVMYLSLQSNAYLDPSILIDTETLDLLCLDDIEAVLGQKHWEEALFHCYNKRQRQGTRLLVASNTVPSQLLCQLKDLQSRLSSGLTLQTTHLEDEQKLKALQIRAQHLGLTLSAEVASYLLHHHSRDTKVLFELLSQLDHASMALQRRITIPFIKATLQN